MFHLFYSLYLLNIKATIVNLHQKYKHWTKKYIIKQYWPKYIHKHIVTQELTHK